ncbi:MAG TPA: redoxin domain-containing protein [Bacteroidales bacterium]|nr:redoxin domain-containing protein [Bacteroidales bacterium]
MKSIVKLFSFILLFFICNDYITYASHLSNTDKDEGYKLIVKIRNLNDSILILGHYFGEYQYVDDTARRSKDGSYVFQGKSPLPGGVYFIVLQNKKHFEFIINKEQRFTIESDTIDMLKHMKFKTSVENTHFYEYLNYISQFNKDMESYKEGLNKAKDKKDEDSINYYKEKIKVIDEKVKNYKFEFINKYPNDLMSKIFLASKDIDLPEAPLLEDGKRDSTYLYYYYKEHYFDNIDFSDDRLLRSPVFHSKLKYFLDYIANKNPDSLIVDVDKIVDKSRVNKEMFKYVVWYITYYYETSKIMGYDAIFVHMVEKYYMTGEAYWVNPQVRENITKRAMTLKPLLIGKIVPNLIMEDSIGRLYSLYNIKAKYIILYFWDLDCGHCKTQTPILGKFYENFKSKGVEVYAVHVNNAKEKEWKKYIKDNNLNFINVWDPQNKTQFRSIFDVSQTPVLFVLDSQFKIVGKKLSTEQLEDFINRRFEFDEKEKNKNN